ncbi:S1C family serine protease [Paenactinomyces guangxiensis]|uniref:Serine protease n=1 Tax=Paenactinomyces guangxiensis TaxID=1490290 RepID=A0A7W1WQ95_9BACL|nr:S1C family serine protease [Paenactinomyces guangxiensis]MBA4494082.1 serine protease [Paenactinomyces guangxiensis]MBH8591173.1 serine protease [Paenactinomyces guangxiensis]
MGFYDQPDLQQQPKRQSPVLIAIISAVIGGLIVLLLTPLLFRSGVISLPPQPAAPTNITGPTKTTSVNVTSDITKAVDRVRPAVVGILNYAKSEDPFNPEEVQKGTGSGIIFEKANGKARVVTNYHVIEGASQVRVVIPSGDNKNKTVNAKVLGSDPTTDLAVLEISDQYVTAVAEFGNSDTLKAGEPAIAIGNPLGLGQSITVGVISSPKRSIDVTEYMATDVIQTDAAINPGNSGGALINAAGQVIGINSLKIAESGVEGLGFAIPSNDAQPIMKNIIHYGYVPRPFLGVELIDLMQLPQSVWENLRIPANLEGGTVIRGVGMGSPADLAGLKAKDVIVALDNQPIATASELRKYLYKNKQIGQEVTVTFYRDGKKETTRLKLAEAPKSFR